MKTERINGIVRRLIAYEFPSEEALKKYLKEHPEAERRLHWVKEPEPAKKKVVEKPEGKKPEVQEREIQETKKESPQSTFFDEKEMSLPSQVVQKAKTEDELYSQAEKAKEQMMDWLDRKKGIDKKLGLKHYDIPEGAKEVDIGYDQPGPILITAPLKSKKRAEEKVEAELDGNWSELADVVRATIAVDRFDDLDGVVKSLKESGMKLARAPKDRFVKPTVGGYRDVLLNVSFPNGHIGELQLHVKGMLKAKESIGHKYYEKVRTIEDESKKEGRDHLTDDEQKIVDELNEESRKLYEAAWEKIGGKKVASMKRAAETLYFEYNNKPGEWREGKFPVIWVKGEETVLRNFLRFFHNAQEITKQEFDKMKEKREASIADRIVSASMSKRAIFYQATAQFKELTSLHACVAKDGRNVDEAMESVIDAISSPIDDQSRNYVLRSTDSLLTHLEDNVKSLLAAKQVVRGLQKDIESRP